MVSKYKIEREIFPYISKPGRYLGQEDNRVLKDIQQVSFRALLASPLFYEDGMASLELDVLYHLLNAQSEIWAERVFMPGEDAVSVLQEKDIPLFSLETKTSVHDFDLIWFLVQSEIDYLNILTMLHSGKISLSASGRENQFPLIIGSHDPLKYNPEPVAEFLDAVWMGNIDGKLLELFQILLKAKKAGKPKSEWLNDISATTGIYIPAFYRPRYNQSRELEGVERIRPRLAGNAPGLPQKQIDEREYYFKPLVALTNMPAPVNNQEPLTGYSETGKNCAFGFFNPADALQVSFLKQAQNVFREWKNPEKILPLFNGTNISRLIWHTMKENAHISGQAIRMSFPPSNFSFMQIDLNRIISSLKDRFAIFPLAGSQRLRQMFNFSLSDEEILQVLRKVIESGCTGIDFYFYLGLPGEKNEDVQAIVALMQKSRKVTVAFNSVVLQVRILPFSPKPATVFQWERQNSVEELQQKSEFIKKELIPAGIPVLAKDPWQISLETALARGDRRMAGVIQKTWEAGVKSISSDEDFGQNVWERAFSECGLEWKKYLNAISITAVLPWDHLQPGISKSELKREKIAFFEARKRAGEDFVCIGMGLPQTEFRELMGSTEKFSSSGINREMGSGEVAMQFGRGIRKRETAVAQIKRRIRLRYTKMGMARFISHLDFMRVFDRAAKRAQIPLVYTQGINPHPKISLGPPLGTGIASVAEYLDIEVLVGQEVDLQNKFNQYLPEGIQILQYKAIFAKVPALAAVINQIHYDVLLEGFRIPETWISEWMERDEIPFMREMKGEEFREVNIRPYVSDIQLSEEKLFFIMEKIDGRMARVTEIMESLLLPYQLDYRRFLIQRTGQYIRENQKVLTPFDVI